ncbi:hypothetical protein B5S31_g2025 [[Candida] boidinii]|nr:hypothetical protein B5S31_g2025 [[Candida] boidinii]
MAQGVPVPLSGQNGVLVSVNSPVDSYTLDEIFNGLKSKDSMRRKKAATDLRTHFVSVSRDFVSSEQLSMYNNIINKRIFDLANSHNTSEQLGSIAAIDSLLELITKRSEELSLPQNGLSTAEENANMITRYANYLRRLIPSIDLTIMRRATETLGKLAIPGGSLTSELVEFEYKRSYEWLVTDRVDNFKKHAAVLIINSLAVNAPGALFPFIKDFPSIIWSGLRDQKLSTREDSAVCLRNCAKIIYDRDLTLRNSWFNSVYNEAYNPIKEATTGNNLSLSNIAPENVHGSILALRELVTLGTSQLYPKVDIIYEILMKLKDYKSSDVRKDITITIPKLAHYDRNKFTNNYMHRILLFYISQLKLGKDRSFILISVGNLALEAKDHIVNYLDGGILENIKDALFSKVSKVRKDLSAPCFYCLANLAIAIGPPLTKYINHYQILKLVLKSPINDNMLSLLKVLIDRLPSLEAVIKDRLLNIICICLSGFEFKHPGAPDFKKNMNTALALQYRQQMLQRDPESFLNSPYQDLVIDEIGSDKFTLGTAYEDGDVIIILQALKALTFFDFRNYNLTEFVRYSVILYIEHENPEVRLKSALTSSRIYLNSPICYQKSEHSLKAVSEVLDKLLTVCITDTVNEIRLEVLKSLGPSFDSRLSQADNVRLLFITLHDENFEIRKTAIKLVGRLSNINPAYIVPSLRKLLIQLLTTLEYSGSSKRKREETAVLLSVLISNSLELTKPYIKPIMNVLLPIAEDNSTSVASAGIDAIGEMSVVGGNEIMPSVDEIMKILIETFEDQSLNCKKEASLKTLGDLASHSGYVIDPLLDYPQLLGLLVNILKSENSSTIRRETIRVIGFLGALDPYRYREAERKSRDSRAVAEQNAPSIDMELLMNGKSPSNDDYFPTVVIKTLLKILKDSSLSNYHPAVIQAIMHIFKTLGIKCVQFLDQVIPGFAAVMHICPPAMLETYFQQLGDLIRIVKLNIRPFLPDIFQLIREFFPNVNLQVTIIGVTEQVSKALDNEFKSYMVEIITQFMDVLDQDKSPNKISSLRILKAFVTFGSNIEPYFHIIVPQIVKLFEYSSDKIKQASIEAIGKISKSITLIDFSSRIIHPLLRLLSNSKNDELKSTAMNTICLLLLQMGTDFTVFIPITTQILVKTKFQYPVFDQLVEKLLNGEPVPPISAFDKNNETKNINDSLDITLSTKKLQVNTRALKNVWNCSECRTKDDWQEWLRRFSIELLKESPSQALRACGSLASIYQPLAKDLFNCSFYSCWNELDIDDQGYLTQSICEALSSVNSPPEIHQTLLNLAEYLEHDEKALPVKIQTLSQYAQRSHVYAKALHYKELEFIQEPTKSTIESLISINNQLQQSDAAIGILKYAQDRHGLELKETWHERLQKWEEALSAYNERTRKGQDTPEITLGKMRCLHALGEWEQLSELAEDKWSAYSDSIQKSIAPLAAAAAWGLEQWEKMGTFISVMKHESPDKSFFNAVLYLHNNNFEQASIHINKARDLLANEITALVSESYNRAYNVIVRVQMLAELEEIIRYKSYPQGSPKRAAIRDTWNKRLLGCQKNVDIWQRMLKVRSLVIKPKDDMEMWIKFSNLCRKSSRLGLAERSLNSLLNDNLSNKAPPHVVYAQLKYMWSRNQKQEALTHLIDFTSKLSKDLNLNESNVITQPLPKVLPGGTEDAEPYTKLLARCYLKQGEWNIYLNTNWSKNDSSAILGSFLLATHFDKSWYKAWHNWALANFDVISPQSKKLSNDSNADLLSNNNSVSNGTNRTNSFNESHEAIYNSYETKSILKYVFPAIKGFFYSISLSHSSPLQDTLRLLTLWMKFGGLPEAAKSMSEGFSMVTIDTWLDVIPQLISRIHQPDPVVSRSLLRLLSDLGRAHPQALVYPLTVAIKSDSVSRQRAALTIIEKMRVHSATLVDQADLVSNELIRVAVLWHEMWYEGLEDASRAYFGDKNVENMFSILEPLHAMISKPTETSREASFFYSFGKDLNDAHQWLLNYKRTKDIAYLNQAWDLYYNVFRRISRQLPTIQKLVLSDVSPKLLAAKNLELALPGTYVAGKEIVTIVRVEPNFTVITSKQRPRKFNMLGSDGKDYQYVLKGHEDIRQDSLVMQLFGLVNTLLLNDPECFVRHMDIQQYAAIPLSPNSGLLGWVPNSDTFHVLIKEYREPRKILLDVEHRIMLQMSPDYDNLTLLEKVEVFTYALDITRGQDLYKVLWFKSKSSESWLDRRTTYTRSLAVMSMVGYILGLGDRHPSNLMMDRITGKVIHIDFGDCFEAAILREKYPEKVPFRLTRMLSYAMEVSGIEGSFRITSDNVMRVLRANKDSLMAILEAFAYDPLINWGLDFPIRKITVSSGHTFANENYAELLRTNQITEAEAAKMESQHKADVRNARADYVLKRITDKLTGNDISRFQGLDTPTQVDKLIQQATSVENLCQHYIGWCSFW